MLKNSAKRVIWGFTVFVLVLAIITCGKSAGNEAQKSGETSDILACLITEVPAGAPFTDLTWKGFQQLEKDLGIRIRLVEAMDKA